MDVRSVIVVKEKVNICPPQGGFFYEEMVLNRTVGDSNLQKSSEISELGVFMATTHVPDHDYDYMKQNFGTCVLISDPASEKYLKMTKKVPPNNRMTRWCGGKDGFDDFVQRFES